MADPKPYLPKPNPSQAIGKTSDGRLVFIDPEFQRFLDALIERVNNLEKRTAALEP